MESDSSLKARVVETLVYADLFDYPMRKRELLKWLIGKRRDDETDAYLDKVNGVVYQKSGFFFLAGRDYLISRRKKRQLSYYRKLAKARRFARLLSLLPTVKLVGVSGSLSMRNSNEKDDIDFFVVTSAGTLWLTRLFCVVLLELTNSRRRPHDTDVKDSICLNMFVDENHLRIPTSYQNTYTAHEVCQLAVLFDREGTYKRFLNENRWVKKYLPNAIKIDTKILGYRDTKRKNLLNILISQSLNIFESLVKSLQLIYMHLHKRQTSQDTKGMLTFYPKMYHTHVIKAYRERLKYYGLSI